MDKRLDALAQMVDHGSRVADIGTDHAYLPIKLVKTGRINFAIASDVAKGPLQNAKDDIKKAGLEKQISVRLGSGLASITDNDQIDTVVIAGMGGKLITQILTAVWEKNFHFPTLILEPNVGEPGVRNWLTTHNYQIEKEQLLEEAGHTYELLKAKRVNTTVALTAKECFFGPEILRAKNQVFYQKWQGQLIYHEKLLLNLNKAKHKDLQHIRQIKEEIKMIKEELNGQS